MVANAITLSRLLLLAIVIGFLYFGGPALKFAAFVLTIVIIVMDAIDGWVARVRGETSELGSVMDIAIDRVVENVYWIVYADLNLVPVWVALVVISRGIITDAIRGFVLAKGETAFEMMHNPLARWLVSGRPMRAFYGGIKAVVFAALALQLALREWYAGAAWLPPLESFFFILVLLTVTITVLRGIPVILESRRYFLSEPAS
ncbi:MAG: CDP-alcohol phosphatidyltransferase family protein [Ardenticatenales bacterium]|nr:CDP-alcohol phosphatidyltransferase family protein [Ardenticatenales bacterium]